MNFKKPICIQICANNEWGAAKEILGKTKAEFLDTPYGEYIVIPLEGRTCIFFESGASKTLAAACQYAINTWNPEIIFNFGTAGGVSEILRPLDIVIANKTLQYDCISGMGEELNSFYEEFTLEIDNSWIYWDNLPFKLFEGIVATADQDIDFEVREKLKSHNVMAADWESGAIAPICKLNSIPYLIIRGISDVPEDGKNDEQFKDFIKNTPLIMKYIIETVLPFLINMFDNRK